MQSVYLWWSKAKEISLVRVISWVTHEWLDQSEAMPIFVCCSDLGVCDVLHDLGTDGS